MESKKLIIMIIIAILFTISIFIIIYYFYVGQNIGCWTIVLLLLIPVGIYGLWIKLHKGK